MQPRIISMDERFRHTDSFKAGFQQGIHDKKPIPGSVTPDVYRSS